MPRSRIHTANYLHPGRVGGLIMWNDPIIEETRKVRDEQAAKFDYDVQKLGQYYFSRQQEEDREIVRRPAKKEKEKVPD